MIIKKSKASSHTEVIFVESLELLRLSHLLRVVVYDGDSEHLVFVLQGTFKIIGQNTVRYVIRQFWPIILQMLRILQKNFLVCNTCR